MKPTLFSEVDRKLASLHEFFPMFQMHPHEKHPLGMIYTVEGTLTPVGEPRLVHQVIPALRTSSPLHIDWLGQVTPVSDSPPDALQVPDLQSTTYQIHVGIYPPPRHPGIFILSPVIDQDTHPKHPHLHRNTPYSVGRFVTLSAACVYAPQDGQWSWDRPNSEIKDLIQWTALWLYAHQVWEKTGVWVTPEAPHDLAELSFGDPCPCGSGKKFGRCHAPPRRRR